MVVPAVSAQEGYDLESSKGIPLATIEDYIVTPYREDSPGTVDPLSTVNSPSTINSPGIENYAPSLLSALYIKSGQIAAYKVYVGPGVRFLEVDLNWGDSSDSVTLSIYTPSGSKLGTYSDGSDGSVNGRIHVNIYPSKTYMGQGTWRFETRGVSVSGTEDYTLNVYKH